jgi:hypothetical protein
MPSAKTTRAKVALHEFLERKTTRAKVALHEFLLEKKTTTAGENISLCGFGMLQQQQQQQQQTVSSMYPLV